MAEEEKKAIEDLKYILFQTIQANECGLSTNDFKDEIKTYTDILNLIEKLLKEKEERDREIFRRRFYEVDLNELLKEGYISKDKIREKIAYYKNEIECEKGLLEQGIINDQDYKNRVNLYNSYIHILNKLLKEE